MKTQYAYTTMSALRAAFWNHTLPSIRVQYRRGKRQNAYPCDVRNAWVDFVDASEKAGEISSALASKATI